MSLDIYSDAYPATGDNELDVYTDTYPIDGEPVPHAVAVQELVVNGRGEAGNNSNFSLFTFDAADAPEGTAGSFYTTTQNSSSALDGLIPIKPEHAYTLRVKIRQRTPGNQGKVYYGFSPYDAYGLSISPPNYMRQAGTTTTLAAPLNNGDTTVKLTDSAGWAGLPSRPVGANVHLRRLVFWNYVDPGGYAWGVETYSRNLSPNDAYADGAIDPVTHTITLRAPWAGGSYAAGTPLSNASSGGTYIYGAPNNFVPGSEWVEYESTMAARLLPDKALSATMASGWPEGTAAAKPIFLLNRESPGSAHAIAAVSVTSVPQIIGYGSLNGTGTSTLTGEPSLSGAGSLTGVGTPSLTAAAVLAGDAALSGLGTTEQDRASSVALSGTGSLSGVGVMVTAGGSAALSGAGTLASAGVPQGIAAAALTGAGALDGAATGQTTSGTGALAAAGELYGHGTDTSAPVILPEVFDGATLQAYTLGGGELGQVPAPLATEWVTVENELSTLKVTYSELAPRAEILDSIIELAFMIPVAGQQWYEPVNARMVSQTDGWERLKDGTQVHNYEFASIASEFSKHPALTQGVGAERVFTSVTHGALVATVVAEIKSRGGLPWLELGFDAETDSRGDPWPHWLEDGSTDGTQVLTLPVPLWTQDFLTLLQKLPRAQWWTHGRTLHLAPWKPGGLSWVHLPDSLMTESPEKINHSSVYSEIVIIGDEGVNWTFPVPGVNPAYGKRTKTIQVQGVTAYDQAAQIAEAEFPASRDAAESFTRQWRINTMTPWVPGLNIALTDKLTADTKAGPKTQARVAGMGLRYSKAGTDGFVTLGTVPEGVLLKLVRGERDRAGGVGVIRGTPKPPPGPVTEDQYPEAPADVAANGGTWTNTEGVTQGHLSMTWEPVTLDTGGNAVTVDRYQVRARRAQVPAGSSAPITTFSDLTSVDHPETSASETRADIQAGEIWEVIVAAVTEPLTGPFSAPVQVTISADTQGPNQPATPTVDSTPGTYTIEWSGMDSGGQPMAPDTRSTTVQIEGVTPAVPWIMQGSTRTLRIDAGPGEPLAIGGSYRARLQSVDAAGNLSPWSEWSGTAVVKDITQWPAVPTGLVVEPETYLTPEGDYRGRINAAWAPVAVDDKGQPVEITDYSILVRRTAGPSLIDWFHLGSSKGLLTYSGASALMAPLETWEVQVGAVSKDGHTGVFSAAVEIVFPKDTAAPPIPAAPTASQGNGQLIIRTTGKTPNNGDMPADLSHFTAHVTGLAEVFVIDPLIREIAINSGDGQPLTVGVNYTVRLKAVDKAGNSSDFSQPSGTVAVVSVLTSTELAARLAATTAYGDNLYPDARYLEPSRNELRAAQGGGFTIATSSIKPNIATAQQIWLTPTGHVTGSSASRAVFTTGREYVVTFTAQAAAVQAQVKVVAFNPVTLGTEDVETGLVTIAAGGQQSFSRVWKALDPAKQLGIHVVGAPTVWDVTVRERTRTVDIGPDQITAPQLFTDQAFVNKVTAALGDFDAVTAGWIRTEDLKTTALDFMTAKGIKLIASYIDSTAELNKGLKMTPNHKRVYNPNTAELTAEEDYLTGDNMQTGTFRTRGAFPWIDIGRNLWADMAGIQFSLGPDWQTKSEIVTNSMKWGNDLPGSVYIRGGNRHGLTMRPEAALRSGRPVNGTDEFWPEVDLVLGIGSTTHGRRRLQDVGQNRTAIYDFADFIKLETKGGGMMLEMPVPNTVHDISLRSLTGGITLFAGNTWIRPVGIASTTGGEDLALETDWKMCFRSSLKKDKLEPRKMGDGRPLYELLQVPGMTWVDRNRREADPTFNVRYGGVIYEDVEKVSEENNGSLDFMLIKRNAKPSGISDKTIAAALLGVVNDMNNRLTALENRG